MAAAQAYEKHYTMRWMINKLIPSMDPLTNLAAATVEESILKISSYRASLNWLQRPSQSTPEYRKLCDEKEHTPLILTKSQ